MTPQRELEIEALLQSVQAELLEPLGFAAAGRGERDIGESRPSPEGERVGCER